MRLGWFCTGLAAAFCTGVPRSQMIVRGFITQCPNTYGQPQVEAVYRDGRGVGAYIDDSQPDAEAVLKCAARFTAVYAGQAGPATLQDGLREWYPVLDHHSRVGPAPAPGKAGYILQAFSWGDNIWDGAHAGRCMLDDDPTLCAARYQSPSPRQLRLMWCRAIQHHPHVVLWYYAAQETRAVLNVERRPCSGSASTTRRRVRGRSAPPRAPGVAGRS
jgi:hypothetical protein